jgi:hypothetical protein
MLRQAHEVAPSYFGEGTTNSSSLNHCSLKIDPVESQRDTVQESFHNDQFEEAFGLNLQSAGDILVRAVHGIGHVGPASQASPQCSSKIDSGWQKQPSLDPPAIIGRNQQPEERMNKDIVVPASSTPCSFFQKQSCPVPPTLRSQQAEETVKKAPTVRRNETDETMKTLTTLTSSRGAPKERKRRFVLQQLWHSTQALMKQQEKMSMNLNLAVVSPKVGPKLTNSIDVDSIDRGNREHCMDKALRPFMIDPGDRTIWSVASLLLLCYDIVVVPMDCFLGLPPDALFVFVIEWVSRIFWSIDLPLNFLTGTFRGPNIEMRASRVGLAYVKSWLLLDILLCGSDWVLLGSETGSAGLVQLLRNFRILRLVRLLRIGKLQRLFSDLMLLAPEEIVMSSGLLKTIISICVFCHVTACCWYGLGVADDNGWAKKTVEYSSFGNRYIVSLHWTFTQLHGTNTFPPGTTGEYVFSLFIALAGFSFMAYFIGKVAHTVTALTDHRKAQMQQICRKYLRTRNVSAKLQMRLNKYLTRSTRRDFKEQVDHETELLRSIPEILRIDLNEETRKPLLVQIHFFRELMQCSPRLMRTLCFEAVTCVVATKYEYIFLVNDPCQRMLCTESGTLTYTLGGAPEEHDEKRLRAGVHDGHDGWIQRTRSAADRCRGGGGIHLARGTYLAEAGLWTKWIHQGDLVAANDATLLQLESANFMRVVTTNEAAATMAVQYAHHYIAHLNELILSDTHPSLSDIILFEADFTHLEDLPEIYEDQHLCFLSHFKAEAGTEATLMEEALGKMIIEDNTHPAAHLESPMFLDSSNLIDLRGLRDKVICSHNLVLLLTSQVLFRPWCLVEIVTAIQNNVNIVPVEILRPGSRFSYPNDEFYEKTL